MNRALALACLLLTGWPAMLAAEDVAPSGGPERARLGDTLELGEVVAEPVTIEHRAPSVGTRRVQTSDSRFVIHIEVTAADASTQRVSTANTRREIRESEVLATDGDAITSLRVTYQTRSEEGGAVGAPVEREVHPVDAHTYLVTAAGEDEPPQVTYEDGSTPPDDELELVQEDYARLGQPDRFALAIPEGRLEPGQVVEVDADVLSATFANDEGFEMSGVELTYLGTHDAGRHTVAAFDLAVELGGTPDAVTLEARLRGRLYLLPDGGWEAGYALDGPIDVHGAPHGVDMVGRGEMRMRSSSDFSAPR